MKKIILITLLLLLLFEPAIAGTQYFWIGGYKYYPLYSICEKKDIEYNWDSIGRIATLTKNGIEARIRVGSDRVLINDDKLEDIGPPLRFYKGMVVIPSSFANSGIDKIFKYRQATRTYVKSRSKYAIKTIVLDPGHGGKDPGAIGRYYKLREDTINLDIAKRLKALLSSQGLKVYLTRDRDNFVSLSSRAEFANRKRADFFISIHTNSSRSKWLRGFETYYLSERTDDSARALQAAKDRSMRFGNSSIDRYDSTAKAIAYDLKYTENRIESRDLSRYLINYIKKKSIYTRKTSLKNARFQVLKNIKTDMPAVLVEVGYISNKTEEALLRTSSYRQKLAEGIANGILAYKREYERQNGFTR